MPNIPKFSDADQVKNYLLQQDIAYVKMALVDLNGTLRGKTVSQQKFLSLLENGGSFYDGILAGDLQDALHDNSQFTGTHTGYPDAEFEVVTASGRQIPWELDSLFFLCDFKNAAASIAPRNILQKVLAKAEGMGLQMMAGTEYEFTVFTETDETVREKNYRELMPLTLGNTGYSIQYSSSHTELYHDILDMCSTMNMPLESIHTEIGPGMLEAALMAQTGITAADNALLFKSFSKTFFERQGLLASFMAKWNEQVQGHGMHIHISLLDPQGNTIFYDENDDNGMSDLMKQFVAGQQKYMAELLAMCAPTINSYARYVPDCWAPVDAIWGFENRAVSLRVIRGGAKAQRIEYRIPGADCNPYLAYAAALASGLMGIEQQLTLSAPYEPSAPVVLTEQQLPRSLLQSTELFANSTLAKQYFGEAFVQDYAASREWEARQYQKAVTDWQLQRYLETV